MPISMGGIPHANASTKKLPTRISDTRLEIVMVSRSLEAANAIMAGTNSNLIESAIMGSWLHLPRPFGPGTHSAKHNLTRVADQLATHRRQGPLRNVAPALQN